MSEEEKKKYVVYSLGNGYYTGKRYMCKKALENVDYYPIFSTNIDEAKLYSSKARAERFIKTFSEKNFLDYQWEVIEYKGDSNE